MYVNHGHAQWSQSPEATTSGFLQWIVDSIPFFSLSLARHWKDRKGNV